MYEAEAAARGHVAAAPEYLAGFTRRRVLPDLMTGGIGGLVRPDVQLGAGLGGRLYAAFCDVGRA
jgi:hypothetical protein